LGLDSRDLLEIVLTTSDRSVLIPAHIWTPWFSVLGSKSGFDSIEACFGDLSGHIFALETGLSSDPPMNWRLSSLDRYSLVSNSDAHSPAKLGREANLFRCAPGYDAMMTALRDREGFGGTIEFFPEEGKYHLDGHRKCGTRMTPAETRQHNGLCPRCGRPVTVGVMYRVEELADRPEGYRPEGAADYVSLVGLAEVLAEVHGVGAGSKRVRRRMDQLLHELGSELALLRQVPLEDIERAGDTVVAEAIRRMRAGEVTIEGGYDGEFGKVHLLDAGERRQLAGQTALFAMEPAAMEPAGMEPAGMEPNQPCPPTGPLFGEGLLPYQTPATEPMVARDGPAETDQTPLAGLNAAQRRAATHSGSPLVIVAGPGTGKTRTLTRRIAYRVEQGLDPTRVLAVTFTNKAAAEMRQRLADLLGPKRVGGLRVCTFHALGLQILNGWRREQGQAPLAVIGQGQRQELLSQLMPRQSTRRVATAAKEVSLALLTGDDSALVQEYRELLDRQELMDLDALIPRAVSLLDAEPELLQTWRDRASLLCVDEYQDVNRSQYELVRRLCPTGHEGIELCVIGDPDQAIYSFRGADPSFFLRFERDYPDAACFTLDQSYRTGCRLLEAAQQVIAHNPDRTEGRRTWSEAMGASKVSICRSATPAAEAEHVVHSIERLMGGTTLFSLDSGRSDGVADQELSFGDFAVLFRTVAQADALREAFARSGMPFICPASREATDPLQPVIDLLRDQDLSGGLGDLGEQAGHLPARQGLALLVQGLCLQDAAREAALEQAQRLAAMLHGVEENIAIWGPQVLALALAATETDRVSDRAEAVSLLTLHASKGLEFPVVFIVGLEEGLLPHLFASEESEQRVAEERRLAYVGMTRAHRLLVLTHAAKRGRHGRVQPSRPSRFLSEIEADLIQAVTPEPLSARRRTNQLSLF
jgi:DNA helicase-2/ATP-dependent DNA helicase PcrA